MTEYLNLHIDELNQWYILPGNPVQGRMFDLMDKTTMVSMAAKRNIFAPEIWRIPVDIDKVAFPCITKACLSSHGGKSDVVVCNSREDLDGFLRDNSETYLYRLYQEERGSPIYWLFLEWWRGCDYSWDEQNY